MFVADLDVSRLSPDDHHHLARVLRLPEGSTITVSDGQGRWRTARTTRGVDLADPGEVVADPPPSPPITIAFALVKGERPEMAVQKLTEVGVDRIVPFVAERSVVRWDDAKADRRHARLTDVARHAAVQCRRTRLPQVDHVATFDEVAGLPGAVMAQPDGDPPSLSRPVVLVGPEGGWSPAELARDLPRVALGGNVLRADTASVTVCALLAALRTGLVMESG